MKRTILIGVIGVLAAAGCGPTRETAWEMPAEPALVSGESVRWAVQWERRCSEGVCFFLDAEKAARVAGHGKKLPEATWATLEECRSGAGAVPFVWASDRPARAEGDRVDIVCKPVRVADAVGGGWVAGQITLEFGGKVPAGKTCPEMKAKSRMSDTFASPGQKAFVECPREMPGWIRAVMTTDMQASGAPLPRYETRRDCLRAMRGWSDPKAVLKAVSGSITTAMVSADEMAELSADEMAELSAELSAEMAELGDKIERGFAKSGISYDIDVVCSPTAPAGPDRDGS